MSKIKRFYLPDTTTNAGFMLKDQTGKSETFAKIHLQVELENGEVYSLVDSIYENPPQLVPFMTIPATLKLK